MSVGFRVYMKRNMPPRELVEAFRSTLEEVGDADLLLHVVDAAHPDPVGQVRAVREVIADIPGGADVPELIALNKADLADDVSLAVLRTTYPGAVIVSAHTGEGVEELQERIAQMLPRPGVRVDLVVPYTRGDLVSRAHETGEIETEEHLPEGTRLVALVAQDLAAELRGAAVA